jgi:hypothetical protein
MDSEKQSVGWDIWPGWFVATFVGWCVGLFATFPLSYGVVNVFHPEETNLIGGLCAGAGIGFAQLVALRPELPLKWVWAPGAVVGLGVPCTVAVLFGEPSWFGAVQVSELWLVPIVVVAGALAGVIQMGALVRHTRRAHWWIWGSVVIWGVPWLVSLPNPGGLDLLVWGLVSSALSGAFVVWLMRTSPSRDDV